MSVRDLIIVGAGPSGLAAAIAAQRRNLDYQVVEQGVLVNSIYRFPPSMVFFTTPELLEIGGLPFVSPNDKPNRIEALRYYRKVVDTYDLRIAFDRHDRLAHRDLQVVAIDHLAVVAQRLGPRGLLVRRHERQPSNLEELRRREEDHLGRETED